MALKASKSQPVRKAGGKRKGANGYKLPDPIPNGEILRDVFKKEWQIGPSIGVGGFGEIYCASEVASSPRKKAAHPYVIKIEPHENGPLFVEMHFYMRVAKPDQIKEWMASNKLKSLGMPRYLGSGSHECNGQSYRFIVMDRYGKNLWSLFLQNNRLFPYVTVLRVGIQVIGILEYIHSKMYVHGDIKGANLLLGLEKGTENQVYLVDFGLASRFAKEYKPDPKKAHNGTIEYTSRDAHMGVPTRRGDLEILGYNMLQWVASKLPWENKLTDTTYVQQQKVKFMDNIPEVMKKCFPKSTPPGALVRYFEYVASLNECEEPDYVQCKKLLERGLKECKSPVEGKLTFLGKDSGKKLLKTAINKRNASVPFSDDDSSTSDDEPSYGKKGIAASVSRKRNQSKQNEDVESDSEIVNEVDHYKNRSKSADANKKGKSKQGLSWRDCPTAIASNVVRAGEYKRPFDDENSSKIKKQKKTRV